MSNSNGRIYVDGTTTPVKGVSIGDVKKVLGETSNDLGTLCKSNKINKWARYKPVSYPNFPIRFSSGDSTFEAMTGLNIGSMIDLPSSVAAYSGVTVSYTHPHGGISSPYRLTDFNRYNHNAEKPIDFIWGTSFMMDRAMYCTVNIYDRSSLDESTEYISFSDIMGEAIRNNNFGSDARLCLAVYDSGSEEEPFWYFFSEKFSAVGSSGSWMVRCNMGSTGFTNHIRVGNSYKFKVMLVSDYPALSQIITGDREVWEYGVSADTMATYESGSNPIKGMYLALDTIGEDETTAILQESSAVTTLDYYLDIMSIEKFGNIETVGNQNRLCVRVYTPLIEVRSPNTITAYQYQLRASWTQGQGAFWIFPPTGKSGDNYYQVDFSNTQSSLSQINLTPWIGVGSAQSISGGYMYELDFANHENEIIARNAPQTANVNSGIYFFFDQPSAGGTFSMSFSLYYKESSQGTETLVRTFNIEYNSVDGMGEIHDVDLTNI